MFNEIGYSRICCLVYFIIFEGKAFHNFVLNIILALGLTNYDYIRMSMYNYMYVQVHIARIHPDQTIKNNYDYKLHNRCCRKNTVTVLIIIPDKGNYSG